MGNAIKQAEEPSGLGGVLEPLKWSNLLTGLTEATVFTLS